MQKLHDACESSFEDCNRGCLSVCSGDMIGKMCRYSEDDETPASCSFLSLEAGQRHNNNTPSDHE